MELECEVRDRGRDKDWKYSLGSAQRGFYMVPKQIRLYFGNRGELTILSGEVQFAWRNSGEYVKSVFRKRDKVGRPV